MKTDDRTIGNGRLTIMRVTEIVGPKKMLSTSNKQYLAAPKRDSFDLNMTIDSPKSQNN